MRPVPAYPAYPPDPYMGGIPGLPEIAIDRGKLDAGQWAELEGPTLRLGTTDPAEVQPILDKLRAAGLMLRRVQSVRPSLEDLFMETVAAPEAAHSSGKVRRA